MSARERKRDASATALRHAVSALHGIFGNAQRTRLVRELRRDRRLRVDFGSQCGRRPLDLLRLGSTRLDADPVRVDLGELGSHLDELVRDGFGARPGLVDLALRVGDLDLSRATGPGRRQLALRQRVLVDDAQLGCSRFGNLDLGPQWRERLGVGVDRDQLHARSRRFRDQRLDDPFVGDGGQLPLEPAAALGDEIREPAAAFTQCLGAREEIGDIVATRHRERALGCEHRVVERAQLNAHVLLFPCEIAPRIGAALLARLEPLDLATGEVQRDCTEIGNDSVVAARGVGLALERPQLAPDLAQQVSQAQEVAFGRFEAALRLLAALAELQDPGGFLDDRPAVFGTGVQHRVELALTHDHVLLAADAGIGEQLLDVEQPARRAVDHVLRLTRAEQRAGDRDLGELDREQPRRVVDRERHLGPAERGTVGGAGEDDVVHLAAAQRAAPWAPSTHATESTMFDLPDPLGPTTTHTPGSKSSVVLSAKDLKPFSVSDRRNTGPPSPAGDGRGDDRRTCGRSRWRRRGS